MFAERLVLFGHKGEEVLRGGGRCQRYGRISGHNAGHAPIVQALQHRNVVTGALLRDELCGLSKQRPPLHVAGEQPASVAEVSDELDDRGVRDAALIANVDRHFH